jgi:hypothetical protein
MAGARQLLALLSLLLLFAFLTGQAVRGAPWPAASEMSRLQATQGIAAVRSALGLTACPLRSLTGIACPACGGTRACLALLRSDLAGALALNPFVVLALGILVAGGGAALAAPRPAERWLAVAGALVRTRRGRVLCAIGLAVATAWQTAHLPG